MPSHLPLPLEWHPAYSDETELLDWLEGRGPYRDLDTVLVPRFITTSAANMLSRELYPTTIEQRHWRVTRRRAYGRAPYVGRPFVYRWMVGIDEFGRGIAGDAHREWDAGRAFAYYLAHTPEDEWPIDD